MIRLNQQPCLSAYQLCEFFERQIGSLPIERLPIHVRNRVFVALRLPNGEATGGGSLLTYQGDARDEASKEKNGSREKAADERQMLLTAIDQGFAYMAVLHGHEDVAALAKAVAKVPVAATPPPLSSSGVRSAPGAKRS